MSQINTPSVNVGRQRRTVLSIVLISYLMIVLDTSIVITGLPKIREGLGFTPAGLAWVHTAYTLVFGGLLLAGARAGDLFGRKRMFMFGLAVFTAASFAIGIAVSPAMLVVARAVQGLGAAVLAPATMALLSVTFAEGPDRTRALGLHGATAGIGASVGMVLGGVLADLLSWRVGFFINVPIGLALLWSTWRFVQETPVQKGSLDGWGAALSTAGMLSLVYGLIEAAERGWSSPHSWGSLATALLTLTGFVLHESRAEKPLLPLQLFLNPVRAGAYAARLLFLAGVIGFWFYLTQYLQGVMGMRPLQAGMAFLPATVVQFFAALVGPRIAARWGNPRVLATGVALTAVGMAGLSLAGPNSVYLTAIAIPMMLLGIGQGLALGPLTIAGVTGVAEKDAGAASGAVNAAHQLGSSIGLSLLVVVFAASGSGSASTVDLSHRVSVCLAVGAGLLTAALLVVLAFVVRRDPSESRLKHA